MVLISNVDDGHWTEIYEHLWGQINQTSTFPSESQPYNQTGTNVQICCSDGRAIFHVDRLLQFTNLLDFALEEENLDHHQDPFGNMTILTPHLKLESVTALGRLIYCGDTGQIRKDTINDIIPMIRSEYGSLSLNISDSKSKCEAVSQKSEESQEKRTRACKPKEDWNSGEIGSTPVDEEYESFDEIISKPDVSPIINICDSTFETLDEPKNVWNPISDDSSASLKRKRDQSEFEENEELTDTEDFFELSTPTNVQKSMHMGATEQYFLCTLTFT